MVKLIMVGVCPECGAQVTSRYPFQIGECRCKNPPVEVHLKLAIIPAERHIKKLREIAEFRKTSIKKLVIELLDIWL